MDPVEDMAEKKISPLALAETLFIMARIWLLEAHKCPSNTGRHFTILCTVVDGNELGPVYPFQLKQLKYEDP